MDDTDWPQLQLSHRSKRAESATHTHSWDLQLGKYCPSTPSRIILGKGNPGLLGSPFFFKPEIVLPQQLSLTLPVSKALIFFINTWLKNKGENFKSAVGTIRKERQSFSLMLANQGPDDPTTCRRFCHN